MITILEINLIAWYLDNPCLGRSAPTLLIVTGQYYGELERYMTM